MSSIPSRGGAGDKGEREIGGEGGVEARTQEGNELKCHSRQQPKAIWVGPRFGAQNWRFPISSAGFIGAYNFFYCFGIDTDFDRRPFFFSKL
jgi:hypothetical protein